MGTITLPWWYDRWRTSPPDDGGKLVYTCDECDKAIYAGDEVFVVSSEYYCVGCMDGFKKVAEEREEW